MAIVRARERFENLWDRLECTQSVDEEYWRVSHAYDEPHRMYHSVEHVKHCLDELMTASHLLQEPLVVEFSAWYHDIVYDTHKADNEQRSAEYARDVALVNGLSEKFADKAHSLILATAHIAKPVSIDEMLLLDADLSILGQTAERFDDYESAVRFEYIWVPPETFSEKRSEILRGFLDRDAIYCTEHFREKYEISARENLRRSIDMLRR